MQDTLASSASDMAAAGAFRFSTFDVTRQVFYASKLSFGIVNLKPIVENRQSSSDCQRYNLNSIILTTSPIFVCLHADVLVVPRRLTPRLSDLTPEEVSDLFQSVQTIGKTIEKATSAKSLTIACQVSVRTLLSDLSC